MEPPPLHKQAIQSATERAGAKRIEINDDESMSFYKTSADHGKISRFPTYALEPYQYQRAASLAKAYEILGDNFCAEDIVTAAAFIESGKLPSA